MASAGPSGRPKTSAQQLILPTTADLKKPRVKKFGLGHGFYEFFVRLLRSPDAIDHDQSATVREPENLR